MSDPKRRKVVDIKKEYRQAKSEIMTELLANVWDTSNYDLEKLLTPLWNKKIIPLINNGLDIERALNDKFIMLNDG